MDETRLEVLRTLSETELRVFRSFEGDLQEVAEHRAGWRGPIDMAPIKYDEQPWGLDPETARQVLQALIARGLLFDDSHGRWDTVTHTIVAPTDLAGRFLAWLRADT